MGFWLEVRGCKTLQGLIFSKPVVVRQTSFHLHFKSIKMGASTSKTFTKEEMATYESAYKPPLEINPSNPVVFFEVTAGTDILGTVEMEVKKDVVPKTAANFVQLATEPTPGKGFKGCPFHRIIPDFMCQGGDFTNKNGTGGRSIYGEKFPDENFKLTHEGPGVLSMANAGRNTNGSQFFLCTATTPWLDGKHVVFGQVIKGYGVVKAMESFGSGSGKTSKPVSISNCGVKE